MRSSLFCALFIALATPTLVAQSADAGRLRRNQQTREQKRENRGTVLRTVGFVALFIGFKVYSGLNGADPTPLDRGVKHVVEGIFAEDTRPKTSNSLELTSSVVHRRAAGSPGN